MKIESSVVGPLFENPSPGWHDFEVLPDMAFDTDEAGQETNVIRMNVKVINDPVEDGRRIRITSDLSKAGGQKTIALVLGYTKVANFLEKQLNLNPDLNEKEWGATYLNPDAKEYGTVVNNMFQKLPYKQFSGKVIHITRTKSDGSTNEDGTPATVTFANIKEFNKTGYRGEDTAAPATEKAAPAAKRTPPPAPQRPVSAARPRPVAVQDDEEEFKEE